MPALSSDHQFISTLIEGAPAAAQLSHSNIVQIYDLGRVKDSYFISMEYVHGKNLQTILDRSRQAGIPLSIERAVVIASRVCTALDYAYYNRDLSSNPLRLCHWRIKPHNILVSYEGDIKLADFGIARAAHKTDAVYDSLKWNQLYMSPEETRGEALDNRSDVYAVGQLLYEMTTGQMPLNERQGAADTPSYEDGLAISLVFPDDYPSELRTIVTRALARDPESRFQDAGLMRQSLDEFLHEREVALGALNVGWYVQKLFET